ncbi:hypothetical protein BaRGS_00018422 [Batillaria attramentaria]|uniref:Uncharacterized protein n=1 Tax=Batillaria attramentaria TaxID=370345 RepID=A0ABD0KT50_9CAEN
MSVTTFRDIPHVLQLECSGEALAPDTDVLTMAMYVSGSDTILAYVNPWKNDCLTSDSFTSCIVVPNHSRKTRLRSLVLDVTEMTSRVYGCNVTFSRAGGWTSSVSWSLPVSGKSK